MAYFEKVLDPKDQSTCWHLILETHYDVIQYLSHEESCMNNEIMKLERLKGEFVSIPQHGTTPLNIMSNTMLGLADELGVDIKPMIVSAISSKLKHMSDIIDEGDNKVMVNSNRGYSCVNITYKMYNYKSLERISAKVPFIFPVDDKLLKGDNLHLVLENDSRKPSKDVLDMWGLTEDMDVGFMLNLNEQDEAKIYYAMNNARYIYMETLALDKEQNQRFVNIANTFILKKDFHIKVPKDKMKRITDCKDFILVDQKHNIKFYN